MSWNFFNELELGDESSGSGGDAGVPKELLEKIQVMVNKMDKDVVFNLSEPIFQGPQKETLFLYPYEGILKNICVGLSNDSFPTSNIIMNVEVLYNRRWTTIKQIQLQRSSEVVNYEMDFEMNQTWIRMNVIEGDVNSIKNMSVIMKIVDKALIDNSEQ